MKRNKEWLKEKLNTEKYYRETSELKAKTTYGELYDRGVKDGISVALEFIEQLDEPEVKQLDKKIKELDSYNDELIRDNNQLRNELDNQEVLSQEWIGEHSNGPSRSQYVWVDDLQNLLVSKQDRPAIPQFVADCIEYYKRAENSLGELLAHIEYENLLKPKLKMVSKVVKWVYPDDFSDNEDRIDLIARAWLDGYEVEKEKRYFIKEPVTGQFLIRDDSQSRGVKWVDGFSTSPSYFTETEIKAIDERYWAFAEEVTE